MINVKLKGTRMATKLNQLLAIEKNVKNKREDEFTKIYQNLQKNELLNGFSKTYQPKDDGGEQFPPESKKVQVRAEESLRMIKKALVDVFDVTASKDATNCNAKADVVVDGKTILTNVPATHLLFIEKKLVDLATTLKKLPTLSQDECWYWNDGQSLYVTDPVETGKTKKIVEYNVIVPATKEHPAQVKETSKDVTIGTWKTVKYSGALPFEKVQELSERVDKLHRAVKFAREEANSTNAVDLKTGEAILGYVFG